jgi:RNA polymerase sigma factor (sigma-70 family)
VTERCAQSRSDERISLLVDHLIRHKSAEIIATLVRIFGIERIELVEDVVQDALIAALKNWSYKGIPANPAGWIVTAARNRAIDSIRREKSLSDRESEITMQLYECLHDNIDDVTNTKIADDRLAMMFVCCAPGLSLDGQCALALKLLAGFSIPEIARAFLVSGEVAAQRVVRAKRLLRDAKSDIKSLNNNVLTIRLRPILHVLYLMFNEGYNACAGDDLVRHDLVDESIRLAGLLTEHKSCVTPEVWALMALFCLQASRIPARVDSDGNLVLLANQDRSRWDQQQIARGMHALDRAAIGPEVTVYHLEAGIAACHVAAPSYEATDWNLILAYYNQLAERTNSPIIALNRAVALAMARSLDTGLAELDRLRENPKIDTYYLYHASRGELLARIGRVAEAINSFSTALTLTASAPEQRFLQKRIASLQAE